MGFSFLLAAAQKERMKRRSRTTSIISRRRAMHNSITWLARQITLDLLIEILARLPPKSVMRFKCVSKFWLSLLSSRYFCNLFLMVSSQHQPRLYMSLLDRCNYSKSLLLSLTPSTSPSTMVFDQDLTIREMGGYFLRVLRGFVCFTTRKKARIYNPTTRQLVILPAVEESDIIAEGARYTIVYFICHDPVNDQYKVLCTITFASGNDMQTLKTELWIFVLEAGGSWRRVAKEFPHHIPSHLELNMNGVLYYLAWTDRHTYMVVSFDVRSEEFINTMQVPRLAGDIIPREKKAVTLIEYGGNIAVFDFTYLQVNGKMDLWIVKNAKKNEWSRKTWVLKPSQMDLVTGTNCILIAKHTPIKGKVILVPNKLISPFYFLYYDLYINDLKKGEIIGIPDRWFKNPASDFNVDMEFMVPSESIMYLET